MNDKERGEFLENLRAYALAAIVEFSFHNIDSAEVILSYVKVLEDALINASSEANNIKGE